MEVVAEKPRKKSKNKIPSAKVEQRVQEVNRNVEIEDEDTASCVEAIDSNPTEHILIIEPLIAQVEENSPDNTVKVGSAPVMEEEPSAIIPTNSQNNFDVFLYKNQQILQTLQDISSIPAQTAKTKLNEDKTFVVDDTNIKPYTEQQLKSLYHNTELDVADNFTKTFIENELKHLHLKQYYLYELLSKYLKVREKIAANTAGIEQLRGEYGNLQAELWTTDVTSISGAAACMDNKMVQATHEYNRSIFHKSVYQNVIRVLEKIQKFIHENHVLYTYSAASIRMQIEIHIEQVIDCILRIKNISTKSAISLIMSEEPISDIHSHINEIRSSISALFAFQRKLIKDKIFLDDTRNWLNQLVAVLLRVANYQDHLFLINHFLRCPAGISTWASTFIQIPLYVTVQEPFANCQINHLLTIFYVILSPIKERKEFLKDFAHSQNPGESNWVLVDSDGEEDEETGVSLRENDLVALLNQLPLGDLFRCILLINRSDDKDIYNVDLITEQHILRFFAFCSVLLKLLHKGLETYSHPKYNQFSKRLSRFIRHIVQYSTDQWEIFLKIFQRGNIKDSALAKRLQTEYDAFFLRAIYYLYTSKKLLAWQFLAVVPYNMVTMKTLWRMYYFLHMSDEKATELVNFNLNYDFQELVANNNIKSQFEEKLSNLDDAEVYYLLNTFANMSLARNESELEFIHCCTMDILHVGFILQTTKESCAKSAKILLTHILTKFPALLPTILDTVYKNMDKIAGLSLFLYEDVPLSIWVLEDADFKLIERLLLNHPVNTDQTKLARMILSRLNWNILPYEKHCDTAVLVLKAVEQEPTYLQWGWQTILRLKLHISDQHFVELGRVQDIERCEILIKGVRENNPLACFVAILMTNWGHLVPLICSNGLNQLTILLNHQKYEAVLFALYQIVPVFITCQECLINSNKFQDILINLLNADRGYISYAKSFIMSSNTTVLQQFGNMIETQIVNHGFYNLPSPKLLVRLWMNSLVSIPNWSKDNSILYLLDVIIKTAYNYQDALEVVYNNIRDLCSTSTPQESSSIISKFKWTSSNKSSYSLIANSLSQYPWLAYLYLEIEHEEKELKTGLWKEILKELAEQKGKISVDNAIKSATSNLKLSTFSSNFLCIYRFAQQAMDCPIDHPILPLFWQKFFILYLQRINNLNLGLACVGEKFFDGLVNFGFLKKIKRNLQETVEFYNTTIENNAESGATTSTRQEYYKLRLSIFQAFLLWLEEPRLQANNIMLQSLPAQYEPRLLSLIINENNQTAWYQYIDHEQIIEERSKAIRIWKIANFREKSTFNQPLPNAGQSIESEDPVERILRRLTSYDSIKEPPEIQRKQISIYTIDISNRDEMFKTIKPCIDAIIGFSQDHFINLSEHKALDISYQDLVPQLFSSIVKRIKKKVPCKFKNQTVLCSGPAIISLDFQEAKRNERIEHEIQFNRQSYESLLENSLHSAPASLYKASVSIQRCVKMLQERLNTNPETAELGVELFYHIYNYFQEDLLTYLPAKNLLTGCLAQLGQSHIIGIENEMPRLLQLILKEPNMGGYLAPYFSPRNCCSSNTLFMYSTITKEGSKRYDVMHALISKFDIENWLQQKTPNLSQRSQFIQNLITALSAFGIDPSVESLALHSLYRKHLIIVFEFQFPEHYGEILLHLLKSSNGTPENNLISESVWIDILNSLANPTKIILKIPLKEQLRQYAQHQKKLSHQELLETSQLIARHFTQERLTYGLYGLYPKCRKYVNIFSFFLGMNGHGLIISMLNTHQGLLGDKLCEKIWPYLREMYAPWIVPYSINNLKEHMATWIQQLTDDRSVLLPWIPSDTECAEQIIKSFSECINFILDTLPASSNILSYIFQWYVSSFAHSAVKEHILISVHNAFILFPWINFWPSLLDLEFMLRVIDQYLPECHKFLGNIFLSIPWTKWISSFLDAPAQIRNRVYYCFLSLLVKLSIEPNIRRNHNADKLRAILIQAEHFDWISLEPTGFQHIMDWVVMSCNSEIIFSTDALDLDFRLLYLLKLISGYNQVMVQFSADIMNKRQVYVRSHIKLLSVYVGRQKNIQTLKESDISAIVEDYLHNLDTTVTSNEETELLLKEILCTINITGISDVSMKVFTKWIENKTYGITIKSLLKSLGSSISNYKYLSILYEATLTSYFNNFVLEDNIEEPSWKEAIELLHVCAMKPIDLEQALLDAGSILTLNAVLLKRIGRSADYENILTHCISWMQKLKLKESIEDKLPLIWFSVINLVLQLSKKDQLTTATQLQKFVSILLHISEENGSIKWGRGLLNAIGFAKSDTISLNFKFICRAMAGYVLAQLPDAKILPRTVRIVTNAPNSIGTPGGNPECSKILLELDFGQSQGRIKDSASVALSKIQDSANSMHNAKSFLIMLLKQFYTRPYLNIIEDDSPLPMKL